MTRGNSHNERSSDTYRDLFIGLCLVIITLAVFWQVSAFEFTSLDDDKYVMENPHIRTGFTLQGVRWAFTSPYGLHPLAWLSHMLDCQLFGLRPGWHHLTSAFIHAANALLLFLVLRRMTGESWRSGFVAALFALHPLHVESVAWVSERKDVLSTFFWMLTLWSYARYAERPTARRYAPIILFFILGLLSKPMVVTLPFVLLLLDYWPLRRFSLEGDINSWRTSFDFRLIWEKIPLLLLGVVLSVVTFLVGQAVETKHMLYERVANALVTYIIYLWKTVWPFGLAIFYPHPGLRPMWQVAGASLVLLSISFLAIRALKRHPYGAVGWLWYLGTLVPVIGIVQAGIPKATADRYTYIPLIGIFIIVAWGIPELLGRWRYSRQALFAAGTASLLFFMGATWFQLGHWKDSITLFEHTLAIDANSPLIHSNLAVELAKRGKLDDAISHYNEALRIDPEYVDAHYNLGLSLKRQGKSTEAIHHYSEALRLAPHRHKVHNNMGLALAEEGKLEKAIEHYNEALRINSALPEVHNNFGLALATQGKLDEAIQHYNEALRIAPDSANVHNNLGIALASQKRYDEAIARYREALRIEPNLYMTHNNLGLALAAQGKLADAIHHYKEALRLKPDCAPAKSNLQKALTKQVTSQQPETHAVDKPGGIRETPMLYYQTGNIYQARGELDRAMEQYQKALSIQPDYAPAMNNLALVHGIKGEYDKALSLYMKIIGLQPDAYIPYYNIACIYSKQNRTEESVEWLKKALEKGFNDWNLLKTDEDLENIRSSPYYEKLISGLGKK